MKPVCTIPDHKYCNYQRQCLPKTDPIECGDDPDDFATFYAPPGLPVFCMDKMRYTNEGNYTAPPIEVADTIWADYKVEYEFTVNATGLGKLDKWIIRNMLTHLKSIFCFLFFYFLRFPDFSEDIKSEHWSDVA